MSTSDLDAVAVLARHMTSLDTHDGMVVTITITGAPTRDGKWRATAAVYAAASTPGVAVDGEACATPDAALASLHEALTRSHGVMLRRLRRALVRWGRGATATLRLVRGGHD